MVMLILTSANKNYIKRILTVLNDSLSASQVTFANQSGKVSLKSKINDEAPLAEKALVTVLSNLINFKKSATVEIVCNDQRVVGGGPIEDKNGTKYLIDISDVEKFRDGIRPGSAALVIMHEFVELSWMQFKGLTQTEGHALACKAEFEITGAERPLVGWPIVYKRDKSVVTTLSWTKYDDNHKQYPCKINVVSYN